MEAGILRITQGVGLNYLFSTNSAPADVAVCYHPRPVLLVCCLSCFLRENNRLVYWYGSFMRYHLLGFKPMRALGLLPWRSLYE